MKFLRSTSLIVAMSSVLVISGCSTSDDSTVSSIGVLEAALDAGFVGEDDTVTQAVRGSGVLQLEADYPAILEALAAYQLESLADKVVLLGDSLALTAIGSTSLDSGSFDVLDRDETLQPELLRTSLACELGGEVIIEKGTLSLEESEYTRRVLQDRYQFDQCRLSGNGGQLLYGSLSVLDDYTSDRHFSSRSGQLTWQGFEWQQGSGVNISSDAVVEYNLYDFYTSQQNRNVSITKFSMTQGGAIVEKVINGVFSQTAESSAGGGVNDYVMSASGSVINDSGIMVHVSTDPAISSHTPQVSLGLESSVEGWIQMTAEDGSALSLTANQVDGSAGLLVDVDYQNANGDSSFLATQSFVELPFRAP